MSSGDLSGRPVRAAKHDYRLLNDGSDEEADMEDRIDEPLSIRPLSIQSQSVSQPVFSIDSQSIEYAILYIYNRTYTNNPSPTLIALDANIDPFDSISQVISTEPTEPESITPINRAGYNRANKSKIETA